MCAGTPTWLVVVIVLACLGSVGLAGFVVYRLRLRSAMHQEIRAIMVRLQCCTAVVLLTAACLLLEQDVCMPLPCRLWQLAHGWLV